MPSKKTRDKKSMFFLKKNAMMHGSKRRKNAKWERNKAPSRYLYPKKKLAQQSIMTFTFWRVQKRLKEERKENKK